MTNEAKKVKEELAALRERRDELARALEGLSGKEARAVRIQLAEVGEDIIDRSRELRRLMPEHRISYRGGKRDYMERVKWSSLEDKTWAEVEKMVPGDRELTAHEMMRAALRKARSCTSMTEKQREYVDQILDQGKRLVDVARDCGVDKSTVSRTVKRGRAHLDRDIKAVYAILRNQEDGTGDLTVVDLAVPEVMEAVLGILTECQRTYLYLYYGEWMSLREIQELLGLDSHSSVLRSIRTALERIEALTFGGQVELRGWDALEGRLMEHFNGLELEEVEDYSRKAVKRPLRAKLTLWTLFFETKGVVHPRPEPAVQKPFWVSYGADRRSGRPELHVGGRWGSGRLMAALKSYAAHRMREAKGDDVLIQVKRAVRAALYRLFSYLMGGKRHADDH